MTEKREWMTEGNVRLCPTTWKTGFSRGMDRFIVEAIQGPPARMPKATVQLVLRKHDFKALVGYLSEKLKGYEEREGEIEVPKVEGERIREIMRLWKPDQIYWED